LICLSFQVYSHQIMLKSFDLYNRGEQNAANILKDFLIENSNNAAEDIMPQNLKAYEFDLNADGSNEIIGIVYSEKYSTRAGYHLFILQKKSHNYEDISGLYVNCRHKVVVLKSKTNGYYALKTYSSRNLGEFPYMSKYSREGFFSSDCLYNTAANNIIMNIHSFRDFVKLYADNIKCYKKFNFQIPGGDNANKVLYTFILKDLEKFPEFTKIEQEHVMAYEFDLNADGINEILGIAYSTYYFSQNGYHLFILQKNLITGEYKDISVLNIEPLQNLFVLKEKTNGYYNLRFYTSDQPENLPSLAVFDSGTCMYLRNKLIHS